MAKEIAQATARRIALQKEEPEDVAPIEEDMVWNDDWDAEGHKKYEEWGRGVSPNTLASRARTFRPPGESDDDTDDIDYYGEENDFNDDI
jgi:hypothetical protein